MSAFRLLAISLSLLGAFSLRAAESIPPKPAGYFTDEAGVVSKETALKFNEQLAQFERETSNQVVVAVYQKMQSDSDIADYAQRVFQAWQIGDKTKRNGILLLVFIADRQMWIQTGYGAEGPLPDATAFDITERRIKPRFREQDYEGGLAIGIASIEEAMRGEYTGSGKTTTEGQTSGEGTWSLLLPLLFFSLFLYLSLRNRKGKRGWGYSGGGGPFIGGWSSGGGGWSGGSSSSGGGFSGFSGGGGSSGGGGAGSSW